MESFAPCYNNISYRQKSRTLQPNDKEFLLDKYFASQLASQRNIHQDRSNYVNVHIEQPDDLPASLLTNGPFHHQHHNQQQIGRHHFHIHQNSRPTHHQHFHTRSQSQHHYHTMYPNINDLNNYYNIKPIQPSPSRHSIIQGCEPPSLLEERPPPPINNPVAQLGCLTIMQVCNELGYNIDSAPPEPSGRNYSITRGRDGLFKVPFPQTRTMEVDYLDPRTRTLIKAGSNVSVLGPSKEDRSLFTICYKDMHIDLPHNITRGHQIEHP